MTVAKFVQPDMTQHDAATYKALIDGAISVLARMGAGFAPRAEDTPSMKIAVDAGVIFNRATGGFISVAAQTTAVISAPVSDSKIVRVYIDEQGVVGKVEGSAAASPVAPSYPPGCFPICQVTISSATTSITNAAITDERAFGVSYGVPKNTFLITSSTTFVPPVGAKFLRVTPCGAGAGAGGGASAAADANKYGGGGGGGGACVLNRLFSPEALIIVIGAGGLGGANAATAGVAASAGTDGGATTVTGAVSGNVITCAGGVKGTAATAAANGTGGAGGTAGTGVAGTAGSNGTTNTSGGKGGGTGTGGVMSPYAPGGTPTSRSGTSGQRGGGGGGGCGFESGGKGGDGGNGFALIEVF